MTWQAEIHRSVPRWATHPSLVGFYTRARCRPADLYPSERMFVPWLARRVDTVLDVGCAAGGFCAIFRHFNPGVRYAGVDLSLLTLHPAVRAYPEATFAVADATQGLPYLSGAFDLVFATGVLVWNPDFRRLLDELWRVSRRYVFVDFRISDIIDRPQQMRQKLKFDGAPWDGITTVPYLVLPWPSALRLMTTAIRPRPVQILGYGYWGSPADSVMTGLPRVCFAVFVLEKPATSAPPRATTLCVHLPLPLPVPLGEGIHVLEPTLLSTLLEGKNAI